MLLARELIFSRGRLCFVTSLPYSSPTPPPPRPCSPRGSGFSLGGGFQFGGGFLLRGFAFGGAFALGSDFALLGGFAVRVVFEVHISWGFFFGRAVVVWLSFRVF